MHKDDIKKDLERAEEALKSADRNFKEKDLLTTANRAFVACENSIYALLKLNFGSGPISRMRILTRLKELDIELKKTYDEAYDLRVQADYGRESKIMPLDEKNMGKVLNSIREKIREIKDKVEKN